MFPISVQLAGEVKQACAAWKLTCAGTCGLVDLRGYLWSGQFARALHFHIEFGADHMANIEQGDPMRHVDFIAALQEFLYRGKRTGSIRDMMKNLHDENQFRSCVEH